MAKEKGRKLVAQNRKARHDYHIHDTYEAGIVLSGTEVKSLREGRANLADAFATVDDGEVWLRAAHIPEYSHGTWTNHTARRTRKLLLNRSEINKIERELSTSGTTLVPLALYFSDGYAKVEIALGHRQAGVRQAADDRGPGVAPRGGAGAGGAEPGRVMSTLTRPIRLLLAFALAVLTALAWTWARPAPAYAAADEIDRFDVAYTVQPSGVLEVKETIVWRFGDDSGRHGIDRWLIVREPYDETQDAVYEVTNISVSSPDPGVATQFDSSMTEEKQDGREEQPGSASGTRTRPSRRRPRRTSSPIEVTGAMRTFSGYDEFFWDATGFGNPWIKKASITAKVPGGAQEVSCFTGPPGSKTAARRPRSAKTEPRLSSS